MGKNSPAPPAAPDYTGAAEATASGNIEAARSATAANRFNQFTPYGSQTWQQHGPDQWSSTISLDPTVQRTLNTQMDLSNQLGDITQGQIPEVQDQYSRPMELGSVDEVYDKAYGAQTARLDPHWQQREQMKKVELANQGLAPGGEAYDNSMREFNQGRNDAYQQAQVAAINTMPQTYQLENAAYDKPLNILNALRTGAQIQNPTFQPAGMQSPTAGANYLGAAQAQGQYDQGLYNSQVGQQNAMTSGLFGLAGAGLGAYGLMNMR